MTMAKLMRISPENLIADWGFCEDWSAGNSSAPGNWFMTGTAGSVARETTNIKYGLYSMKITAGSSGVYAAELRYGGSYLDYQGRTLSFGMWVKCSSASKARIYIDDGVNKTYSSYHTGDGTFQFLSVTVQIAATNTKINFGAEVAANAVVAYFDGGVAVEGEYIFTDLQSSNIYVMSDGISPSFKNSVSSSDLARREGIFISNVKLGEKALTMSVQLWGSSFVEARQYYDSIVRAVIEGQKDLYFADDRILKVFCSGISKIKYQADFMAWFCDLTFIAGKPYEQYIGRLRSKQSVTATPKTFSIPYLGNFKTRPIVNVIAAGTTITSFSLQNYTTGQVMSFSGSIPPNCTLMIDCEAQTITNNGVDSPQYFGGQFLMLAANATNFFNFAGTTPCTIQVDYYNRWL